MHLCDKVLRLVHADPASARLNGPAVVPAVGVRDAMRCPRVFREERRQPDAGVRRGDVAEVPDRVVVQRSLQDGHGLALGRIRERKVERLARIRLERCRVRELRNRLLASYRRAACATKPAPRRLRQGDVRPLVRDDAAFRRFEAIGDAVFARDDANGEVAEVGELLHTAQVDQALLVDRCRDLFLGGLAADDLARQCAIAKPFPVDADSDTRLRD